MEEHTVYLSLGTNLGDKAANLERAISELQKLVGDVVRRSTFYATEPWGFKSPNTFLNACVKVETDLTPRELLEMTQTIEQRMGRKKKSREGEYEDRIIDIDILLYDDLHIEESDLTIPHPLMHEREFVMKPLREIMD